MVPAAERWFHCSASDGNF